MPTCESKGEYANTIRNHAPSSKPPGWQGRRERVKSAYSSHYPDAEKLYFADALGI